MTKQHADSPQSSAHRQNDTHYIRLVLMAARTSMMDQMMGGMGGGGMYWHPPGTVASPATQQELARDGVGNTG